MSSLSYNTTPGRVTTNVQGALPHHTTFVLHAFYQSFLPSLSLLLGCTGRFSRRAFFEAIHASTTLLVMCTYKRRGGGFMIQLLRGVLILVSLWLAASHGPSWNLARRRKPAKATPSPHHHPRLRIALLSFPISSIFFFLCTRALL